MPTRSPLTEASMVELTLDNLLGAQKPVITNSTYGSGTHNQRKLSSPAGPTAPLKVHLFEGLLLIRNLPLAFVSNYCTNRESKWINYRKSIVIAN